MIGKIKINNDKIKIFPGFSIDANAVDKKTIIKAISNKYGDNVGICGLDVTEPYSKNLIILTKNTDKTIIVNSDFKITFIRTLAPSKVNNEIFLLENPEIFKDEKNLFLDKIAKIDLNTLNPLTKAYRTCAYLQTHILNMDVSYSKPTHNTRISLGTGIGPGSTNSEFKIKDFLFSVKGNSAFLPIFDHNIDYSDLDKIKNGVDSFFKEVRNDINGQTVMETYTNYVNFLETAASAKIEGYTLTSNLHYKLSKLSKKNLNKLNLRGKNEKAVLNIKKIYDDFDDYVKKDLNIDLINELHYEVVKDTWKDDEDMKDKTPYGLRDFDICVVDRTKLGNDNVVFIAPKNKDVKPLLYDIITFFNENKDKLHPVLLASIIKAQFVIIHPYGDGNGRTSRILYNYVLMKTGYIDNVYKNPISIMIDKSRSNYYEALYETDKIIKDKFADYEIDIFSNRYVAKYESLDIFRNLDFTPWLTYFKEVNKEALMDTVDKFIYFKFKTRVFSKFESVKGGITINGLQEIDRALKIGIYETFGKKSKQRLLNNGISNELILYIEEEINQYKEKYSGIFKKYFK